VGAPQQVRVTERTWERVRTGKRRSVLRGNTLIPTMTCTNRPLRIGQHLGIITSGRTSSSLHRSQIFNGLLRIQIGPEFPDGCGTTGK
jgi:hypothetical protein